MIAQAAAMMRHPRAFYLQPCAAIRLAPSFRWPAITLGTIGYRNTISAFKLAAGTFAWAAATLAIMTYQEGKQDTAAIDPVRNETIVFRQEERTYRQTEQVEASDDQEGDEEAVPSNYPRVVRTVRSV